MTSQKTRYTHLIMVLFEFPPSRRRTMTMTKIPSRKTCYIYGHSPRKSSCETILKVTVMVFSCIFPDKALLPRDFDGVPTCLRITKNGSQATIFPYFVWFVIEGVRSNLGRVWFDYSHGQKMSFNKKCFWNWFPKLSGVAPANQTKERSVHELFAGAFRNKSSMWIVLVFLRKNTRIHKNGRNSWTFRFGPFFGLVCRGDSWN